MAAAARAKRGTTPNPVPPSPPQLQRFEAFCRLVGLDLEPFQRLIASEVFTGRRELLVSMPRGAGKTTLLAGLGLWALLTAERPAIVCAAASREQAGNLFDAARDMALSHPDVARRVQVTRRELRTPTGFLRVVSADAGKQHGLTVSLAFVDELHVHPNDELYIALRSALVKRPGAQLVTISTAGVGADSPLGRLRTRALSLPSVTRDGVFTRAVGPNFCMLEWSLPDNWPLERAVEANPASWITEEGLAEQREAVHELAFRRLHCNQWTVAEAYWLPAGAWSACAGEYTIAPGERVFVGVDVGGSRAASAVVWLTEDRRVGCEVFEGHEAVLAVAERVRRLAREQDVRGVAYDPWRFSQAALELESEGMRMVEFPQSHSRMVPASERLYAAVVEQRLRHPNDETLNRHVAAAVAKDTPRGWRLDKSARSAQIDAVVALAMALEVAESIPRPSIYEQRDRLDVA